MSFLLNTVFIEYVEFVVYHILIAVVIENAFSVGQRLIKRGLVRQKLFFDNLLALNKICNENCLFLLGDIMSAKFLFPF